MNLWSLTLILVSALTHAQLSLLIKKSNNKQIFCWAYHLCTVVLFAPIPFCYFENEADLLFENWHFLLLIGGLHYLYTVSLAEAFKTGELSLVYPIARSSPAFVLVGAVVFLGEQVSALGVLGITLTVLGVWVLFVRGTTFKSSALPFISAIKARESRFALATSTIAAAFTLLDKTFVASISPMMYSYSLFLIVTIFMTGQVLCTTNRTCIASEIFQHKRQIIMCALLDSVGYILVLAALVSDKASYVVGMRQISIVIAVMMGGLVLKESNPKQRLLASAIIFSGVVILSFA